MKKNLLILFYVLLFQQAYSQSRPFDIQIPDLEDYKTLKCDFHIHTVFSDGLVWPTVRINEAYEEGLDAIALTEHIEYRPFKTDIQADHNRSYEIVDKLAKSRDIILIKGSEITRQMPPGHHNAIFMTDNNKLETPEYIDAFQAAKDQNAFIFWNHPGWDSQQPEETLWWEEHTHLYEGGFMHGIEVANGRDYYPEAHQWCLDKNLTMMGTSDIHQPIRTDIDFAKGEHRTMTLVFAKERSMAGIRDALDNRRTAVFYKELIIGEQPWLEKLFNNSIEIMNIDKSEKNIRITLKNNSGLVFKLSKTEHDPNLTYFRNYILKPHTIHTINIKLDSPVEKGKVDFEVTNLLVAPAKGLKYQLSF